MLIPIVSFFNKVDKILGTIFIFLVSFLNEVDTRRGTILIPISFFSKVDTIKELSLDPLFHFLTMLTQDKELS